MKTRRMSVLTVLLSLCAAMFAQGLKDVYKDYFRELKEMGFDTERTIGIYPGSSWTIVDSEDVLGVNLNIKPKR